VDGRADLHTHTTYSDGAFSPYELVKRAKSAGLSIISITDHDTVDGIDEAIEVGKELDVEVIPGVELSTRLNDQEVHILGYFIDYKNKTLLEALALFREERLRRAERIVNKLNKMNIPLTMESVLANTSGGSVGRPHIATALVNDGHAGTYKEAFNKYIGDGKPAYEKKEQFSPVDTVRLIAEAGGLSFLAHPGKWMEDKLLFELIKSGLDGIEVIHPSHSQELIDHYRGIVNEYCLLESGGSDFHGGMKGDETSFGKNGVPKSVVDMMRRRLIVH
jgi:predicted metal-dependent phosphoesterase TrpH